MVLLGARAASAQTITFEDTPIGATAKGFETALTGGGKPGSWTVVQDAEATGGRAFEQGTPDATDYRFPLAIYAAVIARDLEASIRFKAVSGHVDQAAGLAVRVVDQNNYYVLRANALEDNVRLYRVISGKREQIAGFDTPVTPKQWHTLTLRAEAERFTAFFDGRELFSASDSTFYSEGRVALWTKADSVTRFDRLEIKSLQASRGG